MKLLKLMLITTLGLLSACSSKPAQFYILNAMPQKAVARRSLSILVGPINIASYLQKPQIVTRLTSVQLKVAEHHRWAESLQENISTVLIQNLKVILKTPYIVGYPSYTVKNAAIRIALDITRFDTDPNGLSLLKANWRILDAKTGHIIKVRSVSLTDHVALSKPTNYAAIVAAMNHNLRKLSYAIARSIPAAR